MKTGFGINTYHKWNEKKCAQIVEDRAEHESMSEAD